jgi:catechol 2,3-dioxygenase-like lactoylglutathione lyase family enzyme
VGDGEGLPPDSASQPMTTKRPPRDFGVLGLDHVDIPVRSLTKAVRFFTEEIGMSLRESGDEYALLQCGDHTLGLREVPAGAEPKGPQRVAFRVSEWIGLRSRVMRSRAVIVSEREEDEGRTLRLRGPDGLQVDLVWRA